MATVDQYSLLDHDVPPAEQKGKASKKRLGQAESISVSAAIGRENARLGTPGSTLPRFPGEDAGRSLAEMARADLDAALQLLAERAQYISDASGVAIALRRGEHDDMLCRARAGANAPELGALLSMEYGLSGESVRTRQLLRCDDTERDPRVNRDLCRELKIASVVIVPILKDQKVFGIFELLSDKTKAFGDHDLSALTRLAEMVTTAVKSSGLDFETIACASPVEPAVASPAVERPKPQVNKCAAEASSDLLLEPSPSQSEPVRAEPVRREPVSSEPSSKPASEPGRSAKKPLFWSAALQAQAGSAAADAAEDAAVPAVLRDLKKCQACGFPISQGRTFCVECEEKRWRGRIPAQTTIARSADTPKTLSPATAQSEPPAEAQDTHATIVDEATLASGKLAVAAAASIAGNAVFPVNRAESAIANKASLATTITLPPEISAIEEKRTPEVGSSTPFLNSALPTESWLEANRYILIALLVVALAIGAVAVFH
jgi:uncharacterized Zn finger protein (UPF0148 family)